MRYHRRKVISQPLPQLKMMLIFFSISCLAVLVQALMVQLSMERAIDNLSYGSEQLTAELPRIVATNLLWTFAILTPLTLSIGALVTHRIFGPMKRLKAFLDQVRDGEAVGPVRIRKRDEFQDICRGINEATEPLWANTESSARSESRPERVAA